MTIYIVYTDSDNWRMWSNDPGKENTAPLQSCKPENVHFHPHSCNIATRLQQQYEHTIEHMNNTSASFLWTHFCSFIPNVNRNEIEDENKNVNFVLTNYTVYLFMYFKC